MHDVLLSLALPFFGTYWHHTLICAFVFLGPFHHYFHNLDGDQAHCGRLKRSDKQNRRGTTQRDTARRGRIQLRQDGSRVEGNGMGEINLNFDRRRKRKPQTETKSGVGTTTTNEDLTSLSLFHFVATCNNVCWVSGAATDSMSLTADHGTLHWGQRRCLEPGG